VLSKSGRVYCYQVGTDCYKIGRTKDAPEKRKRGFATGSPSKPEFYKSVETEYPSALEKYVHQLLDIRRAENGEFFRVTAAELDDALNEAIAFVDRCEPLRQEANRLRRGRPNGTTVGASEEMIECVRQLREAKRESFLLERRIELLESRIQVRIGESCEMRGVASWRWRDQWRIDETKFKREQRDLWERYKRNSGSRRFLLEQIDLTALTCPSRSFTAV